MYSFPLKGSHILRLAYQSFKRTALSLKFSRPFYLNKSTGVLYSTKHFPMDKISLLKEDVLLYSLDKTSFIRNVTIFGISQFVVCSCLGFNVFFSLKDTRQSKVDSDANKSLNLGDFKYRLLAGMGCLSMGIITVIITYMLPSRIIKHLTLCKGGDVAWIVTYGPFGKTTKMKVPLKNLNCMVSREQAKSYLPLKMKDRWLFFLIDCKGRFYQPALFDISVGSKNW